MKYKNLKVLTYTIGGYSISKYCGLKLSLGADR